MKTTCIRIKKIMIQLRMLAELAAVENALFRGVKIPMSNGWSFHIEPRRQPRVQNPEGDWYYMDQIFSHNFSEVLETMLNVIPLAVTELKSHGSDVKKDNKIEKALIKAEEALV